MSAPRLPNRIVTGHQDGKAVFLHAEPIKECDLTGKNSITMAVPWSTTSFPTNNEGTEDAEANAGPLHNDTGTTCRYVYFAPNSSIGMHRTNSLDYGICVSGQLELELDDGAIQVVKPGDVVVQRGTIHAWHNRTDQWTHVVYIMVAAKEQAGLPPVSL